MEENMFINNNKIKKKNRQLILDIALFLNKEMLNEKKIPYQTYKRTEEALLKKEKIQKNNNL